MYCLCVDWCCLSCHTGTRQLLLNLIRACIYQATFVYFGDTKSLRSKKMTKKIQYSLYALINAHVTNIYGRDGMGCVYIYSSIYPLFVPLQEINTHTHIYTYIYIYIHINTYFFKRRHPVVFEF
jgi:hypothetical protein